MTVRPWPFLETYDVGSGQEEGARAYLQPECAGGCRGQAGVFKDTCLRLLDRVNDGDFEVVVTKHGTPVARVVPEDGHVPSAHGFMSGTVLAEGDIVSPDFEAWGDLG
jgi:hypothetical protein